MCSFKFTNFLKLKTLQHNITQLMSCIQSPYLKIQSASLEFQHPIVSFSNPLGEKGCTMNTTHQPSNVMSTQRKEKYVYLSICL